MHDSEDIAQFFKDISPKVMELVKTSLATNTVAIQKTHTADYSTQIDLDVERLIFEEIERRFPGDIILAEEGYKDTQLSDGNIWVIDPICGTNNLGRNIPIYCSNIALVSGGTLRASCVVDLCSYEYFWSTGGGKVFRADQEYQPSKQVTGTTIEIDTGATPELADDLRDNYLESVRWLQKNTDYVFASFNSSLSFLYVALHRLDGVMNIAANLWDNAASTFLAMQTGCTVTRNDGSEWDIHAGSGTIAIDEQTHANLVAAYNAGFKAEK